MTLLVLVVLALVYWRTGGQMFNPGPLASAHADIEDCAACHQPFQRTQAELCMECHTEIATELAVEEGLHARLRTPDQCRECHPDHRGTAFDLRAEALANFDHDLTFFSLAHHAADYEGAPIECTGCHVEDDFEPDLQACASCHTEHDPVFMAAHEENFAPDCLACHDGVDAMADFNHAATSFPLTGIHVETACTECHTSASLIAGIAGEGSGAPVQCAACHAEPAVHAGLFQSTCEDCHDPTGWSPALLNGTSFDHFEATGFSLVRHETGFDGSLLDCRSCHVSSLADFEQTVCEQCHTGSDPVFMAAHIADFGLNCLDCHDGLDSMENFDHSTVFVLDGAHAAVECAACHADHQFAGTPATCAGCHAEPAIHAGVFGLECQNCHTTAAWQPAGMTNHTFPLDHGGEGDIPCETCHTVNLIQYTCDQCHAPAEMVEEHSDEDIFDIAGRCVDCHPTGREDEAED